LVDKSDLKFLQNPTQKKDKKIIWDFKPEAALGFAGVGPQNFMNCLISVLQVLTNIEVCINEANKLVISDAPALLKHFKNAGTWHQIQTEFNRLAEPFKPSNTTNYASIPVCISTSSSTLLSAPKIPKDEDLQNDTQLSILMKHFDDLLAKTLDKYAFGTPEESMIRCGALYLIIRFTGYLFENAQAHKISDTDQKSLKQLGIYLAHLGSSVLSDDNFKQSHIKQVLGGLQSAWKKHHDPANTVGLHLFTQAIAQLSFAQQIKDFCADTREKSIDVDIETNNLHAGLDVLKQCHATLEEKLNKLIHVEGTHIFEIKRDAEINAMRSMKFYLFVISKAQNQLMNAGVVNSNRLTPEIIKVRNHLRHNFKKDLEQNVEIEQAVKALAQWALTGNDTAYKKLKTHTWLKKSEPRTNYEAQFSASASGPQW